MFFIKNKANNKGNNLDKYEPIINSSPKNDETRVPNSLKPDKLIPVKGKFLNAKELLANTKWESTFTDGPLLLARLCPVDYHRYHFPDDGRVLDHYKVGGLYHSVNPIALKLKQDIFIENERRINSSNEKDKK